MGSYTGLTATTDDLHEDQLPPLYASLAIEGLPPFHQTLHLDEAEANSSRSKPAGISRRFDDYCRLSLFTASVAHSKVISTNRLVDISLQYCLVFLLDDLLFDAPNDDLLEGFGICRSERESIESIQACLERVNGIFSQVEPPTDPSKIESITWELGHDMRQLSTPDWFRYFAKTVAPARWRRYKSNDYWRIKPIFGNLLYLEIFFARVLSRYQGVDFWWSLLPQFSQTLQAP